MTSFSTTWWNFAITVLTLGGLFGLLWLTMVTSRFSGTKRDADGEPEDTGHVWDGDLRELNNPLPRWWVNMFYITIAFAGIYLALYPGLGLNQMFLGWTQTGQYEREMEAAHARYAPLFEGFLDRDIKDLAGDPEAVKVGRRLYSNYCATCHGSDARGSRGFPNLADGDWLYGGAPAVIKTSIMDGRVAAMPGWETALGGADGVDAMAHYVRSLSDLEHDATLATKAQPQFAQLCGACHGGDGGGNPQFGAPNLKDDIWLYGGSHLSIAESIAKGRNGLMPPHKDFLGEAKVHLLAAYVYSLSGAKK